MEEKKKRTEVELSLNAFNWLLDSRGINLVFIGHSRADEFDNFSKDIVMKMKFKCEVEGDIPDHILNPPPSNLRSLKRYPQFREKKDDTKGNG